MEYQSFTLPNGIRLVHKHDQSNVAYFAFIVNAGTRDENSQEHGIAHFIEHAIFKGTKKRKSYHIISRMDDVGGEINAFTTKEETCIHSTFLVEDYERAMELISDIAFHSTFPEKELEKEKDVVIDEINSYKDSPSELIFDDFEDMIFANHALGKSILGTEESVKKITKNDIENFIQNNYHTDQIVISSVGAVPFPKVVTLVQKYFGKVPQHFRNSSREVFSNYVPQFKRLEMKTYQAHCMLGNVAYSVNDDRRAALFLLTNILGGNGLNSRLNMSLREKHGYAYNVEANYNSFSDTGIFSVYFGTDKDNLEKCIELVKKEFHKISTQPLGAIQLKKAKRQVLGQLAISNENKEGILLSAGKSFLIFNKVESFEEITQRIENITVHQIMEIANDLLAEEKLSFLIFE